MPRLLFIFATVCLASCSRVGNIPNNASDAAFGGDVAGTPGASVIASVGGVEAARVATSAKAVESASNSSVASSLVKRDASGNFAANTVTATLLGNATTAGSADYAMGKQGSNIPSSAVLTLTGDGNFYNVTGTTTISGISPAAAGTHITLYFTGALTLHHSSVLVLTGAGDHRVSSGDVFDFVSRGGGWIETARKVSGDSYLRVFANGLATIAPNVNVPMPFNFVFQDNQQEFNMGTSTFTVRQTGVYDIRAAGTLSTTTSFTAAEYCAITLLTNGVGVHQSIGGPFGNNVYCNCALTTAVSLSAGATIRVDISHNSAGGTVTLSNGVYSYLTITRVRP